MIYTVTLNPAYDKTYTAHNFSIGSTNKVGAKTIKPGGKGINVSRVLNSLGVNNIALGIADQKFSFDIKSAGIQCDFEIINSPVRTNIKIFDSENEVITELNETGAEIPQRYIKKIISKMRKYTVAGDIVIFSGSLPAGIPDDTYKSLITECHKKSAVPILDTSGAALLKGIEAKPFMIKPNLEEFRYLTGKKLNDITEIREEAIKLISGGISKVLVSMGKEGAVLFSKNNFYSKKAPSVTVNSTVGAGDAMLAAFVSGIIKSLPDEESLEFAVDISSKYVQTGGFY